MVDKRRRGGGNNPLGLDWLAIRSHGMGRRGSRGGGGSNWLGLQAKDTGSGGGGRGGGVLEKVLLWTCKGREGSGERGVGSGDRGVGSGERGMKRGEWGEGKQ